MKIVANSKKELCNVKMARTNGERVSGVKTALPLRLGRSFGKNVAEKLRSRMLSLTNENQDLALKLFLSWLFGDPWDSSNDERAVFVLLD